MIFTDQTYEANRYIAQENAKYRKSLVSDVAYEVKLALPKGDIYFGTYQLSFSLSSVPTRPLFVDFRGIKIG